MRKTEQHGFDLVATQGRLETWCSENFASPRPVGDDWPRQRPEAIRGLLVEHWGEHGVGVTTTRCTDARCRVLAVALAWLEMDAYQAGIAEQDDAPALRRAASVPLLPARMRAELLAHAEHIEASPVSLSVEDTKAGRPKALLAQAVAQQLREGGFTYAEIASLMGVKVGATRWHCKAPDVRSLGAMR